MYALTHPDWFRVAMQMVLVGIGLIPVLVTLWLLS